MTRIAVIDDNADLLDDLCFHLSHAGFNVAPGHNGQELNTLLDHFRPQMVILDLGLPGEDGIAIAGRLRRSHPQLGLVILTARSGIKNRIAGHEAGADYYLTKPVEFDELITIVRTLARRLGGSPTRAWRFCPSQLQLHTPLGLALDLTTAEAAIISALLQAPSHQASRKELIQALGADWITYDERRLEAIISRLRKKIAGITGKEAPLRALRGVGYSFLEPLGH